MGARLRFSDMVWLEVRGAKTDVFVWMWMGDAWVARRCSRFDGHRSSSHGGPRFSHSDAHSAGTYIVTLCIARVLLCVADTTAALFSDGTRRGKYSNFSARRPSAVRGGPRTQEHVYLDYTTRASSSRCADTSYHIAGRAPTCGTTAWGRSDPCPLRLLSLTFHAHAARGWAQDFP